MPRPKTGFSIAATGPAGVGVPTGDFNLEVRNCPTETLLQGAPYIFRSIGCTLRLAIFMRPCPYLSSSQGLNLTRFDMTLHAPKLQQQ